MIVYSGIIVTSACNSYSSYMNMSHVSDDGWPFGQRRMDIGLCYSSLNNSGVGRMQILEVSFSERGTVTTQYCKLRDLVSPVVAQLETPCCK